MALLCGIRLFHVWARQRAKETEYKQKLLVMPMWVYDFAIHIKMKCMFSMNPNEISNEAWLYFLEFDDFTQGQGNVRKKQNISKSY